MLFFVGVFCFSIIKLWNRDSILFYFLSYIQPDLVTKKWIFYRPGDMVSRIEKLLTVFESTNKQTFEILPRCFFFSILFPCLMWFCCFFVVVVISVNLNDFYLWFYKIYKRIITNKNAIFLLIFDCYLSYFMCLFIGF